MNKILGYLACIALGLAIGLMLNMDQKQQIMPKAAVVYRVKADSAARVVAMLKQKDTIIAAKIKISEAKIQEKIDSVAALPDSVQLVAFIANFCDTISDDLSVSVPVTGIREANMTFVELEATKSLLLDVREGYENRGKVMESQDTEIANLRGAVGVLTNDLGNEKKKVWLWKGVTAAVVIIAIIL